MAALLLGATCTKQEGQRPATAPAPPDAAVISAAIAQDARAAELVQADLAMWKRGGESLFGLVVDANYGGKTPADPVEKTRLTQTLRKHAHVFLEHYGALERELPASACSSKLHDGLEDLCVFVAGGDSLLGDLFKRKGLDASIARPKTMAALPELTSLYHLVDVDAETLGRAYAENAAAGDASYLGKRVRVKGKLQSVQRNAITQAFVVRLDGGRLVPSIHATMHPAEAVRLATLKVGSSVDLICTGSGQAIRSPTLRACRLAAVNGQQVQAVCQ